MSYDRELADRVRAVLSDESDVKEIKMFGGLTFMVNGKMTATANTNGDLMVRCDPDRIEVLLDKPGSDWPSMRGRKMSKGWVVVDSLGTDTDEDLEDWVHEALTYNHKRP